MGNPEIVVPDMWDPNTWTVPEHEHRIYLTEDLSLYAVVDEVDYVWAVQWRWAKLAWHGGRRAKKIYARRGPSEWSGGVRIRVRTVLLHVEIMKRTGIEPPSELHRLVDHENGDSLDCRRINLRWVTSSMNRKNVRKRCLTPIIIPEGVEAGLMMASI